MNKSVRATLLYFSLSVPCAVFAQANCDQLQAAIEDEMKEVSFHSLSGVTDNSAPRQTNRKLEQLVQIGMIQINLTLMQASKCNMPKVPVQGKAYKESVWKCINAFEAPGERGAEAKPLTECDRSKWVRDVK